MILTFNIIIIIIIRILGDFEQLPNNYYNNYSSP